MKKKMLRALALLTAAFIAAGGYRWRYSKTSDPRNARTA